MQALAIPLHNLEKAVLRALLKVRNGSLEDLSKASGLKDDQARRAIEWLRAKKFLTVETKARTLLIPKSTEDGITQKLPERRLVNFLSEKGGKEKLSSLAQLLGKEDFAAAVGYARSKNWIKIREEEGEAYGELLNYPKETEQERLLKMDSKGIYREDLTEQEREAARELINRSKYLVEKNVKTILVEITSDGLELAKSLKDDLEIDSLTADLLISGNWRKHRFRSIDVESPAPTLYAGKKNPLQRFIDEVREIFVSLGFTEIEGTLLQPCFWNFDTLFIPQDHSAREMQDTFYIEKLTAGNFSDGSTIRKVRKTHEDGWETGSSGWGYKWNLREAKRVVLRTHTTAATVKYLADHKVSEARVFSVGRVFRNEKVTYKNLVEFHQIEGIAVGPNANLREMMGLLSTFYSRLGLNKVKFWPSFFPYTEPSLQSVVYVEKLNKWIELCGMGIFRPEVTLPLGVRNPVLAWGGGLERLVMLRYGLDDVRTLYNNELGWLRRIPLCR